MTATLSAEGLTKKIGQRTIVDSVSFELLPGEVYGFLGPNGAGKTTTIRMIVGLITPTAGSVQICGYDVRRDFERAMQCVGCIVETPDLYRFLTGRENLEHFARMLGPVDHRKIEETAALVAMENRLDDRVGTYSLGMRQRLGIAQALLGTPRLLVLDEPANGLDPAGIREIRQLLRTLAADGLTVFVSSHLLAEVELMCDRVAIIHHGRLLRTGRVDELVTMSHDTFVRTSNRDAAREIARMFGAVTDADGGVLVAVPAEAVPQMIAAMAAQQIDVYEVTPRTLTLEELFLQLTGGESVGA